MKKRGVLIGCGFFSENHLHAWAENDGAEIVAICDLDTNRLATVGDMFGIERRYTNAADMIKAEQPDFVDIATTSASHRSLVELCAPSVGTVICQKPIAESLADARAMVNACKTNGAHLIIHENFRWQRAFMMMKAMIDEGSIGTPHFARFAFRHGYDNYANQPYLAQIERFTIMDVGLHLFDLARHFMGEVERLACTTQRLNPIVRGEDAFTALLQHENGATSVCDCSFYARYSPEPFPNTAAVIEGDQGTLELGRDFKLTLHTKDGAQVLDTEPDVPAWGAKPWHAVQQSVASFQEHVVDVMNGKADPQPSGLNNLQTLKLALAAYEAAEHGVTINIPTWCEDQL
ncbi:MAG: Gfo/Idh/MocA family oxidoreductase [Rhodobacteraceae bacterium]|nr:Gfo/Idh/MocA family oxidoreductase [Paracoccaceae bacterium]